MYECFRSVFIAADEDLEGGAEAFAARYRPPPALQPDGSAWDIWLQELRILRDATASELRPAGPPSRRRRRR